MKKYSYDSIVGYIEKTKDLNVLVIGETIIDEYQYGYTLGKAGKFPIVAFQNEELEVYDGGILAIYNHLRDFCDVDYYTSSWTIVKKRYVQNGQKLFESYRQEHNHLCTGKLKDYGDYDLVIVADFGHGFLTKDLRDDILLDANYVALNTQFNAGNMGMNTINKYVCADYVCIDENELRLATSNQYDDIKDIIKDRFIDTLVSITLSKKGTLIYKKGRFTYCDALEHHPIDTVGAGDAYFAITSLLAYMKAPPKVIGYLGNIAGAIACNYQGNKEHIEKDSLYKYIKKMYNE